MTRPALALIVILLSAASIRIAVASTRGYIWDEHAHAIALADKISFSSTSPNLPMRGPHHPALPSYIIKFSSELFGTSPLGYRALQIGMGLVGILAIWQLATLAFGERAGLWSAALLAFNEYHFGVSSLATAKGSHLFFLVLSIYAFGRFLLSPRPVWLYLAAIAVSVAYYAKEHAVLILPVFALVLLQSRYRHWYRSPHLYGAVAVIAISLAPDIWWNVALPPNEQARYADQFSRIGGLGLNGYPFLFFAHHGILWVYPLLTGSALADGVAENPSMNNVLGLLLFGCVVAATIRRDRSSTLNPFLITLFWVVFLFFVSLRPGTPTRDFDAVAWYWVDVVMFPAVLLSARALAATGKWAWLVRVVAIAGMVLAIHGTLIDLED